MPGRKSSDVTQTRKGRKRNDPSCLASGFSSSSELASEFSYGALFQLSIKSPGQFGTSSRIGSCDLGHERLDLA